MATTPSGIADQVGRTLSGRYRLVAPIGTGASAQVHLADDVNLQRRVAVKVLHPALAADEDFLRRFRAEARAAAALSHPNIMAVYDWGEDDGPFLVLELLSGGSLRAMLDTGHRLSLSQALVIGLEAGRALEIAHKRGFVHRDIKPANLLFGDDGRLRIADFGLARALSEAAWTEPGDGLVGTARYAAPEQAAGVRVDGKADVYSLALVLVESVTGAVPRVADSALATIRLRADEPIPVPPELGPLRPILERVLQPDPLLRPDASELVAQLLIVARELERPAPLPLVGLGVTADDAAVALDDETVLPARTNVDLTTHAGPTTEVSVERTRHWWRYAVALLVVAALVAGSLLLWQSVQPPSAEVPNLAGRSVSDAEALISNAATEDVEWRVAEQEEFSDGVERGVIIRTEPPQGNSLDDGGTLTLIVSNGPEPVPVPSLVDVDEATARSTIEAAELTVGTVSHEFSETIAAGLVTGWSVEGEEKPRETPKGSAVDIRISDGPEPRVLPELTGAPQADAEAELTELALTGSVTEEFSDAVAKGLVTRTDPVAGQTVERGGPVTLYVSKGPDVVAVPNVVGMSRDEAIGALEAVGFEVNIEGPARGEVFETDPPVGSSARRGSEVTIYLKR